MSGLLLLSICLQYFVNRTDTHTTINVIPNEGKPNIKFSKRNRITSKYNTKPFEIEND